MHVKERTAKCTHSSKQQVAIFIDDHRTVIRTGRRKKEEEEEEPSLTQAFSI